MALVIFIRDHLFTTLPYPQEFAACQKVTVTGANVGSGLEAARHSARQRAAKVILAVRDQQKGEAAKRSILNLEKR